MQALVQAILTDRQRALNQDGYELRFCVNYLAPFLLTHLLLPCLQHTVPLAREDLEYSESGRSDRLCTFSSRQLTHFRWANESQMQFIEILDYKFR